MPRTDGVSSRVDSLFSLRRPRPRTVARCDSRVPLKNGSIHHKVVGEHGASHVLMAPAPAGTGIIAGGPMRAVFEVMGVTDIVCKSLGSSNPYNLVRATLDALKNSTTPADVAAKRGLTVEQLFS